MRRLCSVVPEGEMCLISGHFCLSFLLCRQLSRRYKKLESQVLTLAKSVSQLSADIHFMLNEEMESLRHEVEMLKSQMSNVKQNVSSLSKSQQQVVAVNQHQQQQLCTTLNRNTALTAAAAKEPKKVDKLKR